MLPLVHKSYCLLGRICFAHRFVAFFQISSSSTAEVYVPSEPLILTSVSAAFVVEIILLVH